MVVANNRDIGDMVYIDSINFKFGGIIWKSKEYTQERQEWEI